MWQFILVYRKMTVGVKQHPMAVLRAIWEETRIRKCWIFKQCGQILRL